jgi:hypothetical protein
MNPQTAAERTLRSSRRLFMHRVWILNIACALAAPAFADGNAHSLQATYQTLLDDLAQSDKGHPDSETSARITSAAQSFQSAIERDGGARPNLTKDARNIVASLADGTFSASGSIDALRRDAASNAMELGAWDPSLPGTPIPGAIGTSMNQTNEGDCVGISVIKSFSTTRVGAGILRRAVTRNANGTFNVSLPGDPLHRYVLRPDELDQFGKGDLPAAAIVGALFRYFHLDPRKGSLPTNKVMELLAGEQGEHARLADAKTTPRGIEEFLARNAHDVGNRTAMVFGGKPGPNGDWTRGDGHAFAVIHIELSSGMLTYTNPWNEATARTISISDLARQAAGTSADFEIIEFH